MYAKRSFGQNFLQDRTVVVQIVASLDASGPETVIEIGAGRGVLTAALLDAGLSVTAVEFERDMIAALRERFAGNTRFDLVEGDVLEVDLTALATDGSVKVIGNLPYNISTAILQRLADSRALFSRLVLMFQREVAERITAAPATSERGFLSVISQNAFNIERLFDVPPTAFRPEPKVWSSVVRLTPKPATIDDRALARLVSIAFASRRKTILNNLRGHFPDAAGLLAAAVIDPGRRAETLDLAEWHRLLAVVTEKGRTPA